MKIQDIYNKHVRGLTKAARAGRPFAAMTYGPQGQNSKIKTFADRAAASAFLAQARPGGQGGVVVETNPDKKGKEALKTIIIPPTRGYFSAPDY